jgi:high affinity Mn2+ porin
MRFALPLITSALCLAPVTALADSLGPIDWHAQATLVEQGNLAFNSQYQGPNSLSPDAKGRETFDFTLYVGAKPWKGAEIWVNPEVDQGFGLQNTLGLAGYPSGEAYKIGSATPYFQLHRFFLRQTFGLGRNSAEVEADLNQFASKQPNDRVVVTIGKFGVTDIFDANPDAHDPRHDFLNWSVIDTGTFDYAADAWGFSVGAAVEVYKGDWTWRLGVFDLSVVPNNADLDRSGSQFQIDAELEKRFKIGGHDGAIVATGFLNRARMGLYQDAIDYAAQHGGRPDLALVRRYRSRDGVSFNGHQSVGGGADLFFRAGWTDGSSEPYEFADIDRTWVLGASVNGARWKRAADTWGVAVIDNGISRVHRAYLNAGGLGILIGDGALSHSGDEHVLETYYDLGLSRLVHISLDYQFFDHPAYNVDRGPISVFALRIHFQR